MKIKVVIHEVEEGEFWAGVPAISGCATQGDTFEELLRNLYEAIAGCLSVDVESVEMGDKYHQVTKRDLDVPNNHDRVTNKHRYMGTIS